MQTNITEDKNSIDESDSKLDIAVDTGFVTRVKGHLESMQMSTEEQKIVTYIEVCKKYIQHVVKKADLHLIGVEGEIEWGGGSSI